MTANDIAETLASDLSFLNDHKQVDFNIIALFQRVLKNVLNKFLVHFRERSAGSIVFGSRS